MPQIPVLQLPVKIEEKKEEIKVEEKKDVVVQSQTQSETKTAAVPSAATKELTIELTTPIEKLPSEMIFKDASFVYKEANDKSQKTWWFKKGTLVLIVGINGDWIEVRDAEKRKGFVNKNVLVNKQLQ